jgi:hypothetical protein
MTINQGRGRGLPRGGVSVGGRGSHRSSGDIPQSSGRGRGALGGISPVRGRGRPRGTLPPPGMPLGSRGGASCARGSMFPGFPMRGGRQQQGLEPSRQQASPLLASTGDEKSSDLENNDASISQPPTLDPPLESGVEYVKRRPFGIEEIEIDPLQGLGRVFDPHHGGSDTYIYAEFLTEKSPVVVSFSDLVIDPIICDITGEFTRKWLAYGSLHEHYDNNFITMILHPDTQYPSIELLIKRENGKIASFRVFANSLKLVNAVPHLESFSVNEVHLDRLDLEKVRFTRDFYKRPNIGQIVLDLLPQGTSNNNPSLEDRPPIWGGDITEQEILNIVADYKEASALGALSTFSKSDAVIARLSINTYITISLALEGYDNHRYFDESMIHFKNCLKMCSTFGNLWFYIQLAEQYGPADGKRYWADAPRPYWLAIEWAIERNGNGEIIKASPSKWSKPSHPGQFPDERTRALIIELHELDLFD